MTAPSKKQFPGILVIIVASFLVYITVVTVMIIAHYKRPSDTKTTQTIQKSK